jgi:hypothetical protein
MVNWLGDPNGWLGGMLLAQQKAQTLLTRLDSERRAKVLAALAGLIILGFGLVALAWLGARFTRRYMNQGTDDNRSQKDDPDDWAATPMVKIEKSKRAAKSDET